MALSSQMSRSGLSRRHVGASHRPHSRRWPWLVMIVGLAGVIFAIQWLSDGQAADPSIMTPAQAVADPPAPAAAEAASAAVSPAAPSAAAQASSPAIPSLTLRGQAPQAAAPAQAAATSASPAAEAASAGAFAADYAPDVRSEADVAAVLTQGMDLIAQGRMVEGRRVLSALLFNHSDRLAPADAQAIRDTLASVNQQLVFSPTIVPGDPAAEGYRVQRGDTLSAIGLRYHTPYGFLERINGIEARRLQAGQRIKVIHGPFHARVVKSDYRMDIFLTPAGEPPIYVCSFPVGLGEAGSTPVGHWIIEPGKKVTNPAWSNPRTGEHFAADDPDNPIGQYWLALKGTDPGMEKYRGYGIHGTIDPESVGQQMSMGCVRLRDADIERVFKMLEEGASTVEIVP